MICLRKFPPTSPILSLLRFKHGGGGDIYETPDKRRVFYNKQRSTCDNLRMVKDLEVPDLNANSEKPGRGTVERFVPRIATTPVKKIAPNPDQIPSHRPFAHQEYLCQGNMMWKKSDGCVLCNNNITVTYKDVSFLYQFVSNTGMLLGPHTTGLCRLSHQIITDCIETARDLGLMAHDYKPLKYQKLGTINDNTGVKDAGR